MKPGPVLKADISGRVLGFNSAIWKFSGLSVSAYDPKRTLQAFDSAPAIYIVGRAAYAASTYFSKLQVRSWNVALGSNVKGR